MSRLGQRWIGRKSSSAKPFREIVLKIGVFRSRKQFERALIYILISSPDFKDYTVTSPWLCK